MPNAPKLSEEWSQENLLILPSNYSNATQRAIDRLPACAVAALLNFDNQRAMAEAAIEARQRQLADLSYLQNEVRGNISHLHNQLNHGVKAGPADLANLAKWEKEDARIAKRKASLSREDYGGGAFSACISFIQERLDFDFEPDAFEWTLAAGETFESVFATNQDKARALVADRKAIDGMSEPPDAVKERAANELRRRAERGAPNVSGMFKPHFNERDQEGYFGISFPHDHGIGAVVGSARLHEDFFIWANLQSCTEKMFALIDEEAAKRDGQIMSRTEKELKLAEIDEQLLTLDRETEAIAKTAGYPKHLKRRPAASPLAMMGIQIKSAPTRTRRAIERMQTVTVIGAN